MLALALLAGCAPASVQEPEDGKLHIVATVFPAYDFARATAGDLADVELLLPPGNRITLGAMPIILSTRSDITFKSSR